MQAIINSLKTLLRGEKNKNRKEEIRKTLNLAQQEKKEDLQRRKESRIGQRKLQKIRGYWDKSSNLRWEEQHYPPQLLRSTHGIYKHYRLENNTNAKTVVDFLNRIKSRVLNILEINTKTQYTLSFTLSKLTELKNRIEEPFHLVKPNYIIGVEEDKILSFDGCYDFFLTKLQELMTRGSGWQLKTIDFLAIKMIRYTPMKGGEIVELPKYLIDSKSVLIFKNYDEFCFKWAITYAIYPQEENEINNSLIQNSENLNWNNVNFPAGKKDIKIFEKNNADYSVYVYGREDKNYYIFYRSSFQDRKTLNLIFCNNHFLPIKNENSFQKTIFKSKHANVCKVCLYNFPTKDALMRHFDYCNFGGNVKVKMPKEDSVLTFFNHPSTMYHPIILFADIEAILKPISQKRGANTIQYQKHEFSCLGVCELKFGKVTYHHFDDLKDFTKYLYSLGEELEKCILKNEKLCFSVRKNVKECEYCNTPFTEKDWPVTHHSHMTGKYLGTVHNSCNLKLKENYTIPIFFHNLGKYDEKYLIREFKCEINIVAKNLENFITFSCPNFERKIVKFPDNFFRFIDSYKFLHASLDVLVQSTEGEMPYTKEEFGDNPIFLKKGVFPYDYITSDEVLNETTFPKKEDFYSILKQEHISDEDYERGKKLWDLWGCKDLREFQHQYLKLDCFNLCDVFQNFRNNFFNKFEIDAAHHITLPSFCQDCFLKSSKISLELISDLNIYNFLEGGIHGGESFIAKRFAVANNKYMKNYNPNIKSSFIINSDATALYSYCMGQKLPFKNFRFSENLDWEKQDCFVDVDVLPPEHLKRKFSDYPLFPEKKNGKLVGDLYTKENYRCHSRYLKKALELGYKIIKINAVLLFDSKAFLKDYIDSNTADRKTARNDFEKNMYKAANNIMYGKMIENVRERVNIKIVPNCDIEKKASQFNFKSILELNEDTSLMEFSKLSVTLNKPIYGGLAILNFAKIRMYEFWYDYLQKKYGVENINLLMTDTDSFLFEVYTDDFYEDIREDIEIWFDTSNFPENFKTLSGNPIPRKNKKVPGLFKDELGGTIITHFCGLRSKQYAYVTEDGETIKKCKGVTKAARKEITFEDYVDALHGETKNAIIHIIKSKNHELFSETVEKVALDRNDEKRKILEDGIHTVPWGY